MEENEKAELNERIRALYEKGHSIYKIATEVDVTPGVVSHRVRMLSNAGLLMLRGRMRPTGFSSPKVPPPTPSVTEEDGIPMSAAAIAVRDVPLKGCRWPMGDPFDKDFKFCCAPIVLNRFGRYVENNRYCDEHTKGAYNLAGTRRK